MSEAPGRTLDVAIVGGGPAGSTLAWALRDSGLSVAIIDKADFPRDKTCAGWITPQIAEELQLDLEDYRRGGRVLQPIQGFHTGLIGGRPRFNAYDETVSYGILRREFDHYLLQRAAVPVSTGKPVRSIRRRDGLWQLDGLRSAKVLVGAGGHFCPVARHLGAQVGGSELAVAAKEVEFELSSQARAVCPAQGAIPELYFCPDLKGYGWVFRKGDYLNVGLGREDTHGLSQHLQDFVRWLQSEGRLPDETPKRYKGHAYLLYPHALRSVYDDGVLLIGDAAGMAYAQSGEGIRPAIESALLAAATLKAARGNYSAASLAAYDRALRQRFGDNRGSGGAGEGLPRWLHLPLGRALLSSRRFARHVLIDRWFLHRHTPPLALG